MAATVGVFVAGQVNGNTIPDLEDGAYSINQVVVAPEQDGQPTKQLLADIQPAFRFSSLALDVFLALNTAQFATKGVALSGAGAVGFVPDTVADAGKGSTGTKFSMANGILIPESIEAELDAPAVITAIAHGRSSDGDASPLAIATGQALPSFSAGNVFSLGTVGINGTDVTWAQRASVQFGFEVRRLKGDGQKYSNKVIVTRVAPSITVTVADQELAATLTAVGVRQGATSSKIRFRKWDPAGTRVATATAAHIIIAIAGSNSLLAPSEIRAGKETGTADIVFRPIYDGTNQQLTVTTGVAYS